MIHATEEKKISKTISSELNDISNFLLESGAQKVYLFGSHLNGKANASSDIDIGVKGLDGKKYFSVWNKVDSLCERTVDLVDFDDSADFFDFLVKTNSIELIGEKNEHIV